MRFLAALGLLVLGAAVALATVALHELSWGLALGITATVGSLWALPPGWWTRLAFALGWVAMLGLVLAPRPEGDYAVGQGSAGYALIALALAVLVAAITTLPRPRRGTPGVGPPT